MFSKYKIILIVGFGASSLNIRALLSASAIHKKQFYFLDTLDPYSVASTLEKIDANTAIIFISKSGNTHETNLLLEYMKHYKNLFIMSSGITSNMYKIAQDIEHKWLQYPDAISGRFALLEKPFLDIVGDADGIVKAAQDIDKQKALDIANKWLQNFENGKRNWVIINYSAQLQGLLLWMRQIISESLGKNGFGIMPIIAEGTMDEHSQLQLFLDGPDDKFYDVISSRYNSVIARSLVVALAKTDDVAISLAQTEHAFMVESMLKSKGRDVVHTCYDDIDDAVVGNYIGTYSEVVRIIADRLGFDPYNQPAVEDIKQKSKEI